MFESLGCTQTRSWQFCYLSNVSVTFRQSFDHGLQRPRKMGKSVQYSQRNIVQDMRKEKY